MTKHINKDVIYVFGSNEAGIHGAGAARTAHDLHGAEMGVGVGITGHTYALPTKDKKIQTLSLDEIRVYVAEFVQHARDNPKQTFILTPVGTGLAGYTRMQILQLVLNDKKKLPENLVFHRTWFEDY